MSMKVEALVKASDGLQLVVSDLREALARATALEGVLLLKAIGEAVALRTDVETLLQAIKDDTRTN